MRLPDDEARMLERAGLVQGLSVGRVETDIEHRELPKSPAFVRPLVVGRAMTPTAVPAPANLGG